MLKRTLLLASCLLLLTLLGGCRITHTIEDLNGDPGAGDQAGPGNNDQNNNGGGGNGDPGQLPGPAADTIYAMPRVSTAAVNTPVGFVVYTGETANPLTYVNGVGIVVPEDAVYVAGSFNAGAPGGAADDVDGFWTAAPPANGYLLPPDNFIVANPTGAWAGHVRWDFNLTPLGGQNITGATGDLFNFEFTFSVPGRKNVRLEQFNGVNRTYYSDSELTEYYWGTLYNNSPANDVHVMVQ